MSIRRASSAERPAESGRAPGASLGSPFGGRRDRRAPARPARAHGAHLARRARSRPRANGRRHAADAGAIEEGAATSDGIARMLAVRHHLPVDRPSGRRRHGRGLATNSGPDPRALGGGAVRARGGRPARRDRGPGQPARDRRASARDEARARARRRLARGHHRRAASDSHAPPRRSAPSSPSISTIDVAPTTATISRPTTAISDGPLVRLVNCLDLPGGRGERLGRPLRGRRKTLSSCASGSTASCARCSASRRRWQRASTTRLKVLAKLDIAERRKPQDGRITLSTSAVGRDARHPRRDAADRRRARRSSCGSSTSRASPRDGRARTPDAMRDELEAIVGCRRARSSSPGPTARESRRPSTAALARHQPARDQRHHGRGPGRVPPCRREPGADQPRAGLTFATALRSILRPDPDVVMVGEIRDVETAKISIEAALTGHFVLSTLHTNDAPSTITRLGEMGVEPFLTGAAVLGPCSRSGSRGSSARTAARRTSRPKAEISRATRQARAARGARTATVFYRKKACPRCNHTGLQGPRRHLPVPADVGGDRLTRRAARQP